MEFEGVTQDEPEPCKVCGDAMGSDRCPCGPCGDCAKLTARFALNRGVDARWRCPACHLKADLKMCGERPAFRPTVSDLYAAAWSVMARGR